MRDPETDSADIDSNVVLPSLGWVRAFVTTAQCGSMRAAAVDLNTTPNAVRRAVGALERHTGSRLLQRTRGGVRLTSSGRFLLPTAQRLIYLAAEAMGRRRRSRRQLLRAW